MKQLENSSIVIVGVGGQGTLLASRILGTIAVEEGWDVKVSEVHGMAQRGGTVITFVRMGSQAVSPLIEAGGADCILAFEEMEAMRALPYLNKDGVLIANTQQIMPMSVVTGAAQYPQQLSHRLQERAHCVLMDAYAMAEQAGEKRAVNLVLLGALCALTGGGREKWERAIRACVPAKILDVNLRAFEAGAGYAQRMTEPDNKEAN